MALCLDRSDPSGLGMFSNCGRREVKKYMIFSKKEEILNNKQRFFDPNAVLDPKKSDDEDDIFVEDDFPDFKVQKPVKEVKEEEELDEEE